MALDGTWDLRITTPMGTNTQTLDLTTDGETVTGVAHTMGGDAQIENGRFAGDKLTFELNITAPFAMHIVMDLAVDGDSVSGTSQANTFPPSQVEGERKV